jgi:hypothetical protein
LSLASTSGQLMSERKTLGKADECSFLGGYRGSLTGFPDL